MRKQPTAEQKQRAAEKRAKMRELSKQIAAMSDEQRAELVEDWPTTIEGNRLSPHNACMIAYQGGATVVGGFRQWIEAGRAVRKGEHGFSIWVPVSVGGKGDDDAPQTEQGKRGTRFILGTVFDISQTDAISEPAECAA